MSTAVLLAALGLGMTGLSAGTGDFTARAQQKGETTEVKIDKPGLRQFHVRGLAKAQMEMLWACLTYNLQHWIRLRKLRATPAVT